MSFGLLLVRGSTGFIFLTLLTTYRTTTAAKIAASFRWTRFSAIETVSPNRPLGAKYYVLAEGVSIEAE